MKIKRFLLAATILFLPGAAMAKWHEASSPHFVVYANESPERLKAFATKLERFDKAMRFVGNIPDVDVGAANRLNVYVVSNVDAVQRLAGRGSGNVAGFYIGRASGSVAFVPRKVGSNGASDLDADTIFFHEYAHHFTLGLYNGAPRLVDRGRGRILLYRGRRKRRRRRSRKIRRAPRLWRIQRRRAPFGQDVERRHGEALARADGIALWPRLASHALPDVRHRPQRPAANLSPTAGRGNAGRRSCDQGVRRSQDSRSRIERLCSASAA